ncbi:MAG TPA: glycosyltransferase family 4 protein [Gaiellaceae bacterium]|nr:glycosyltransferase family 4 protein [Gaiellaceae bacterium]
MRVLVISGIWPPDVGGPASHAPEVAEFLLARGHSPRALVGADAPPPPADYPVEWIDRGLPPGVRHARATARIAALASASDVVYTTGMLGRSGAGCAIARTPYVVKLTADPAYERARRLRLTHASLAAFQAERSLRTLPLRLARDRVVRGAAHVVAPSSYLRELALGWGARGATVLPNPAPALDGLPPREELRARLGFDGPTVVYAGRLVAQKALPLAVDAVRSAGLPLVVAGDGPERGTLERLGHARLLGPLPRRGVLELFRAGDVSILSSAWENFPHGAVESLAAGTPVVATDVGGVREVVRDGENGLLVPPGDADALARALRRAVGEAGLLERLRAAAAPSVAELAADRVYGRLLDILAAAAGA